MSAAASTNPTPGGDDRPVLVFGDDGSPSADVAWLWICEQHWPGWRAEVVTASPPPLGPPPGEQAAHPHPWEPPTPRVDPGDRIDEISHLRSDADPRYVLGALTHASLMVIGARGAGLLKALHLGSTAEYLLHQPPGPLVIPKHATPVRRVVVAVDGSAHASRAIAALRSMPWVDDVEQVLLLGVKEQHNELGPALDAAAALLGPRLRVEAREAEVRGSVAGTLLAEAEAMTSDLVVLGTRGLGPVRRMLAGSTASAVTRLAKCAVLLAHDEQA